MAADCHVQKIRSISLLSCDILTVGHSIDRAVALQYLLSINRRRIRTKSI
jgi:hypothetical protein